MMGEVEKDEVVVQEWQVQSHEFRSRTVLGQCQVMGQGRRARPVVKIKTGG